VKRKFDAVNFQRKAREELSEKYNADREAFWTNSKKNMAICGERRQWSRVDAASRRRDDSRIVREDKMIWGYAGVWAKDYGVWDQEDRTMARLEFVVKHGFKSTWFPLQEMRDPKRRDQIAAFVAEHGLRLTVHPYTRWFQDDQDAIQRKTDEFARDLENYKDLLRVPIVTMAAGQVHRFMDHPCLEEQMDHLGTVLTPVAEACHEIGCPLGIENHGDYYCSDLAQLCQRVRHLGIFLDTGNTYLIGEKPIPAAREAAPYVIGTHFKDHKVYPDVGALHFVLEGASLGHGHVGLAEIYQILRDGAPHPDDLVMHWELVPPHAENALDSLNKSWEFIRSLPGFREG